MLRRNTYNLFVPSTCRSEKYDDAYKLQFLTKDQPREQEMNVLLLLGVISPHSNETMWADN